MRFEIISSRGSSLCRERFRRILSEKYKNVNKVCFLTFKSKESVHDSNMAPHCGTVQQPITIFAKRITS
ncbi:unnamed protein product [Rhizophagus irregularis]|nr:unnamed protein product [Rhizophagus irregularis]CAB5385536.1 unnamed protein product [Rhizophagus irregularis]